MELLDALRTTGAVREFTGDAVPDEALRRILDTARFAPSGGNRQAWRVVVIRDQTTRRALRDLYLEGWYQYLAMGRAGLVPWAPVTDRDAESRALGAAAELRAEASAGPGGFAEHLDRAPALLLVLADLSGLAAVDRDLPRYTFAGGASVYPFVWSLLLSARAEGYGGVLTTMPVRQEPAVKELVGAPEHLAVAALVVLGRPARPWPRRLTRSEVDDFCAVDTVDGPPLA